MWRLSVRPSPESKLAPVDVVVVAEPGGSVADLAAGLGEHVAGGSRVLLAPTTGGIPWPARTPLTETGLHDGDVLDVTSVPTDWLDRPAPARAPRAIVQILTGPDAGSRVPVTAEVATIGRAATSAVQLRDPLASRTHARLLLGRTPVLVDEGSAHGTRVAGRLVNRPHPLAWGEHITIGDTVLTVRPGSGAEETGERSVWRSPRFGTALTAIEHDAPTPPNSARKVPFQWPMMLMPVLMGGAMFAMMRNAFSLIFMVGFPLMMVANFLMQRRTAKREFTQATEIWHTDLAGVLASLDAAAGIQRSNADEDDPDADILLNRATTADRRVWVRQLEDADFAHVRAGRGPRPALVTAKLGGQGDRGLRAQATAQIGRRAVLAQLPVTIPLGALTAVVGENAAVDAWVRCAVIRLAVSHSPNDVRILAALGPQRTDLETWLRWLPHAAPLAGGLASAAIGAGDCHALLEELARIDGGTEHVVCVIDENAGIPRRVVEGVAALAEERRLHLVWLGEQLSQVPAATEVAVDTRAMTVEHASRGGVDELTSLDQLDLAAAWRAARALGGYRDEAALVAGESSLPQTVRLPELSADVADVDEPAALLNRWAASTGLRAQLGMGADGVVSIDLREDGPHGLVAGTTGAGKSELLQSLLCSLAINNPPERITFLLVDYKGGAAFRECAQLPHTVGYITDLTPALVQRALTSLHAELSSREHLLNTYGAKDLPALERSHPEVAPPSMLICVDEFAALLAEVPEFVDGMVSIAQRGRSLGMHMLLATQRPAGVVTPQIKANTDLRIALRVASADDSVDVVDASDAAQLSRRTPGRALLRRTGHGTRELVQVAYVGAHEPIREAGERVQISAFTARELPGQTGDGVARLHPSSDLERIVASTTTAFLRSGRPAPSRPWIPPLPVELPMVCLEPGRLAIGADAHEAAVLAGASAEVTVVDQPAGQVLLGLRDRPADQAQKPWLVDYAKTGHLLIFGASGSGKTELLRTLAAAVTAGGETSPACVYGIDAGGGGLTVLERLSSVGSIVVEQSLERMLRLIRMVHRTVTERNALLASHGVADLTALAATGVHVQRIHLLIDNLPAVLDSLEGGGALRRQHAEQLISVLQEGRRCGVHVSATAPQRTGLPSQVQAAFGGRLVLRMSVADDYAMLGVPANVLDGDTPPGRGLLGSDEVQVATVGGAGTPLQAERLDELAGRLGERYESVQPAPVPTMPTRVPQHLLPAPQAAEVVLGVEENVVGPVSLTLTDGPLLIVGRSRSGRSSALLGLAQLAARSAQPPAQIVLAGPRIGQVVGGTDPAALVDLLLPDAAAAAAWAEQTMAGAQAAVSGRVAGDPQATASGQTEASSAVDGWRLLLVDNLHEWERAWEAGGEERQAVEALTALVGTPGLAIVAVTDPDEARSRQHIPGLVAAIRRARRAVLIAPEMGDGTLVGVQVPMNSHEPLTGTGRGLLAAGGSTHVMQLLSTSEEDR